MLRGISTVYLVPYPYIFRTSGYSTALISIEIECFQGIFRVIITSDDITAIFFDANFVVIDGGNPFGYSVGRSGSVYII